MSIRQVLLLFLTMSVIMVGSISVDAHLNKSHLLVGESQASKSGIKGVCNGDPVAYIIRQHPNLLTHKRDKVLRQGAKLSNQYSLQGCVNCHAAKDKAKDDYHDINQSGQFCATCHDKVAVSLDCFDCHRTTPYNGKTYYKNNVNHENKDE